MVDAINKRRLSCIAVVAVLAGLWGAGEVQASTPGDVELLPWVEFNFPDLLDPNDSETDRIVDGLAAWASVTDTVIVSTAAGKSQIYNILDTRLTNAGITNLTIIPGIKSRSFAADGCQYDDPNLWSAVAAEVQTIINVTGTDTVLLENEKMFCCYYTAGACDPNVWCNCNDPNTFDANALTDALQGMPDNIHYIWWPGVCGSGEWRERTIEITEAAQDGLEYGGRTVQFFSHLMGRQDSPLNPTQQYNHQILEGIAVNPVIPIMWFYPNDPSDPNDPNYPGWWEPDQINGAMCHADRCWDLETVCPYPGYYNWDTQAPLIAAAYDDTETCCADATCDGEVDGADLAAVVAAYGSSYGDPDYDPLADFDDDGDVDLSDHAHLLSQYPSSCY